MYVHKRPGQRERANPTARDMLLGGAVRSIAQVVRGVGEDLAATVGCSQPLCTFKACLVFPFFQFLSPWRWEPPFWLAAAPAAFLPAFFLLVAVAVLPLL